MYIFKKMKLFIPVMLVTLLSGNEIIIDNLDSKFSTSGSWSESGAADEYAGSSLFSRSLGSSATWTPALPEAGSYEVYVWYSGSSAYDRDTNADYTVNHAGGSENIVIDQNQGSGEWVLLGLFSFNAGSSGNVTLLHDVKSGGTSADAVKFVQGGKVIHQGQVKDSSTGNSLANVKVSLGEFTTITDANGFYTLSNLAEDEEAVVNFEKEGYLLGSTHIQIKTDSSNYLEYGIHAHDKQWNYDSIKEVSSTNIVINTSVAYIDTEGNPYSGAIAAKLTILDLTTDKERILFPGTFKGINSNGTMVQFNSYGLISISLKDSNGDKLSLADGETATLGFDAVSSLEKPNILPLWSYDYEQGLWFEEGYAELQADGTYKGEISHLGTWSLNRPIENDPGIYRSRIVFEDQTSAKDVRVYAVGANWMSSDLSTDEDGMFEIEVIPDSNFQLKAYNIKDKYEATYDGTISAIASGDVVESGI